MALGYRYFIHHGRSDPHSARNCHSSGAGSHHSRAEGPVGRDDTAWISYQSDNGKLYHNLMRDAHLFEIGTYKSSSTISIFSSMS